MFDPDHPPFTAEMNAQAAQLAAVMRALWKAHPELRRRADDPEGLTQAFKLNGEFFFGDPH